MRRPSAKTCFRKPLMAGVLSSPWPSITVHGGILALLTEQLMVFLMMVMMWTDALSLFLPSPHTLC
jgi:hypothetical protein